MLAFIIFSLFIYYMNKQENFYLIIQMMKIENQNNFRYDKEIEIQKPLSDSNSSDKNENNINRKIQKQKVNRKQHKTQNSLINKSENYNKIFKQSKNKKEHPVISDDANIDSNQHKQSLINHNQVIQKMKS